METRQEIVSIVLFIYLFSFYFYIDLILKKHFYFGFELLLSFDMNQYKNHYPVNIVAPSPTPGGVDIEKGTFGSPSTKVANFTYYKNHNNQGSF